MVGVMQRFVWLAIVTSTLSACAQFHDSKEKNHEAICNQLKYQMVWQGAGGAPDLWGGATGNQMQPTQTRAEAETLEKNYHDEGCDL